VLSVLSRSNSSVTVGKIVTSGREISVFDGDNRARNVSSG
jgi:hypothetical protein